MKLSSSVLALALLLAAVLAGCTAAKDAPHADDPLAGHAGANATLPPATNATPPPPAPVARLQVFRTGGALLYETPFAGGDGVVPHALTENESVTFTAGASESPGRIAALVSYAWRFDDGLALEGTTVSRTFDVAGVFGVTLTVTDSNGRAGNVTVKLGVNPPVVVETSTARDLVPFMVDPATGSEFDLVNTKTHVFAVNGSVGGVPTRLEKLVLRVAPDSSPTALDLNLRARNETATFGEAFSVSQSETLVLTAFPVGKLLVDVVLNQGAAGSYVLTVEAHHRPIHAAVQSLLAGDGHGHAH